MRYETPLITIQNHETGEVTVIRRDVCYRHSEWIHAQCGSSTEVELQRMLDQLNVRDFLDEAGVHSLGRDVCGLLIEDA